MGNLSGAPGGLTDIEILNLEDLADVVVTSPVSGQVLTYANGVWENLPGGSGSGSVTKVSAGGGLTASTNPITTTGDISIADTTVSAGTYTLATLTVNSKGQITTASNGAAGTGTVTSVSAGGGLTASTNPIIATGDISIANGGVTVAKLANAPANTVLSNNTSAAATPAFNTTLVIGTGGYANTPNTNAMQVTGSANNFYQISIQNLSSAVNLSSSDFVATSDDGSDTTHYVNLGINGSHGGANAFNVAHAAYLYTTDNELDIAAIGSAGVINFYTAGSAAAPTLAASFSKSQVLTLSSALSGTKATFSGIVSAAVLNASGDIQTPAGRVIASAATLTGKFTGVAAAFSGIVSADAGLNTTVISANSINLTGDILAAGGRIAVSAATITGKLTGQAASFSSKVSADAGLNTTTVSAASISVTGDINASTGRIIASAATFTAKLTGQAASFSAIVSADAGINTTTVSAASIGVTGDINAAAGRVIASAMTLSSLLTGQAATFSSTISASNLGGTNTGDVTVAGQGYITITGQRVSAGLIANSNLTTMAAVTMKANATTSAAAPADVSLSTFLDAAVSGAQGDFIYRGASSWVRLAAGTSGQVLSTNGVSANPTWITAAGTGTVTSVSGGAGLTFSTNPITTAGDIRLDTSAKNNWTAQQGFAAATLTDASAINWNLTSQQVAKLTRNISGTGQIQDPTNMQSGNTYILQVTKGSANTATLTWTSAYRWPSSTAPVLTTSSGAVDIFTFVCIASVMYGAYTQNYSAP